MTSLHLLAREIKALSAKVSPFISMEEMTERYGVCTKTILAMERRGEIPKRVNGRWKRVEVMDYEMAEG